MKQKKEFTYLNKRIREIYYLVFGLPIALFIPATIEWLEGPLYWIVNFIMLMAIMLIAGLISGTDKLPRVKRKGHYWKEDGRTAIETEKYKVVLDDVREIYISDRSNLTKSVLFSIKNGDKEYEFMSEVLKSKDMEDTSFYNMFGQILAENPSLEQEKDIFKEPIPYWYKRSD